MADRIPRETKADPKPMDRATWQRVKLIVEHEACHRDWGCALYTLHRTRRIDNDQREAGDEYAKLVREHKRIWHDRMGDIQAFRTDDYAPDIRSRHNYDVVVAMGHVVADGLESESEAEVKKARLIGQRYREAKAVVGLANSILEDLLIDEIWPTGMKQHRLISHALTRLSHFFNTGTKRKHSK